MHPEGVSSRQRGAMASALLLAAGLLVGCAAPPVSPPAPAPCPPMPAAAPWGTQTAAMLCPLIQFPPGSAKPTRSADFTVTLSPQGTALDVSMFASSGSQDWDRAAAVALRLLQPYPELDGRVPAQALVFVSPWRINAIATPRNSHGERQRDRQDFASRLRATIAARLADVDVRAIPGNPAAEFELTLAADGSVTAVQLARTSGIRAWDDIALGALQRIDKLPLDGNEKTLPKLTVTLRPR